MNILEENPEIEFIVLADHAEVMNGKIYMMGGGWDKRVIIDFQQPQAFSLMISILIPWNHSNQMIPLSISTLNADGQDILPKFVSSIVVGRPVTSIVGQPIRYPLAVNMALALPGPGTYAVVVQLGQQPERRVIFFAGTIIGG